MHRSITKHRFSSQSRCRENLGNLIKVLSQGSRFHTTAWLHAGELVGYSNYSTSSLARGSTRGSSWRCYANKLADVYLVQFSLV